MLLERRGLAGLRVEDVLDMAGLSTRAFYRHFQSKDELFLTLFEEESNRAADRLETLVEAEATPVAQVRAWVRAVLVLAYDTRLAARAGVFAREEATLAAQFPNEVDGCVALQLAPLEAAITAGRDDGSFPHADPAGDARAIHHLCSGLMGDRLRGVSALTRDEAIALGSGFALQALGADGRDRRRLR